MPETTLGLEDVAFFRAWTMMADDCEQKIKKLVAPLEEIVQGVSFARGKSQRSRDLFGAWGFYAFGKDLINGDDSVPTLWAGISASRKEPSQKDGAYLEILIYAGKKHALSAPIRSLHKRLQEERNQAWKFEEGERLLELSIPLIELLQRGREQGSFVQEFVKRAISDLEAVGVRKIVEDKLGEEK